MSNPTEVGALVTAASNLTQAVIDTRAEIMNTVNAKIVQLDNWKKNLTPASISAESRYASTIDLTGLSTDRYYPVWWPGSPVNRGPVRITILRSRRDNQELDPFNDQNPNVAGLLLDIEQVSSPSASPKYFDVLRLRQVFRKTVRNIRHGMRCSSIQPVGGEIGDNPEYVPQKINPSRSGLYLRGGLTYTVLSNYHAALSYSNVDEEVEISTFEDGSAKGRWMVKSYPIDDPFLGPEYDNFLAPYNAFPVAV